MWKICIVFLLFLINCKTTEFNYEGCTDPLASNYNSSAIHNNGNCIYGPASVSPVKSWLLPDKINETSGLIIWNDLIWTINDSDDTNLYAFDTVNIDSLLIFPLYGTFNIDWEEISQDNNYLYIGDFGNNADGSRKNLKIYRIEKKSILTGSPLIDTIHFEYPSRTDFSSQGPNNTDFDCEAFIVNSDSIYLFTKQWITQRTNIYSLPKQPGDYIANYKSDYNVQGLITGAACLEKEKLLVLCGYTILLQPFLYLFYDYKDQDFFSGNKRKISINLPFHQVEGIATKDGLKYYISNEYFNQSSIVVPQKLHLLDLTKYLNNYLNNIGSKNIK